METMMVKWEDEIFHGLDEPKENHCMKCGAIIPEGRHICLTCEGTNEMQTFERRKPTETPTPSDAVNHPEHYQGAHECIDEMLALFGVEAVKGFCMCNVYGNVTASHNHCLVNIGVSLFPYYLAD